jgi:DNA polymerase-1
VLAVVSGDKGLLEIFRTGRDLHDIKRRELFPEHKDEVEKEFHRFLTKKVNFGIPYRITALGLTEQVTEAGMSEDEWQAVIDAWFEHAPGVRDWQEENDNFIRQHGYAREPVLGRIRYIPEVSGASHPAQARKGLREAGNMPIQAGAQAIIKIAMQRLWEGEFIQAFQALPICQIHDSLMFEVDLCHADEFAEMAKEVMENAYDLGVPIPVDVKMGYTWRECK